MIKFNRYKDIYLLLQNNLNIILDDSKQYEVINQFLQDSLDQPLVVSFLNAHALNMAVRQPDFLKNLYSSSWLLRDGIGISLLCRSLGLLSGVNMNGTDLIPVILEKSIQANREIILLGTESPWLDNAKKLLTSQGGNVCLTHHGFHNSEYYIRAIDWTQFKSPVVILAMGMPKQEQVANALFNKLPCGLILNGGAVLDFIGGKVTRAPLICRRLRLEWLYRLFNEPLRLFKRYVIGNFVFLTRIPLLMIAKRWLL